MKKYTLFIVVLLVFFTQTFAQNRDYPIITQNEKSFYLYEVKTSDGLFKISKIFNVSQEEILKYNQHALSGLSKGMKLLIPVIKKIDAYGEISPTGPAPEKPSTTNSPSRFKEHTVIAKETLYSLSKQYGLSIQDIIKHNPALSYGLKVGQVLQIPTTEATEIKVTQTKPATEEASDHFSKYNTRYTAQQPLPQQVTATKSHQGIIKVALLMPFMLVNSTKHDPTIDKFIEFYEGVLIALSQLKKDSISIELLTYDIEKTETKAKEILQKNHLTLKQVDLIIGPAYSTQVEAVAAFAEANYIPLIVPFSPKIPEVEKNPYLFQNNTPHQKQFIEAAKLFSRKFADKNIVFLDFNNDTEDMGSEFTKFLRIYLKRENIAYNTIQFTQEEFAGIHKHFIEGKETILLFGTEKASIIKDLLPRLSQTNKENTTVSVFGFSNWEEALKTYPSTYYYSSFFINRNNKQNGIYRNIFRKEFGYPSYTTSPRFDLLGYDIAHYFIKAIALYGKKFGPYLGKYEQKHSLQSKFRFEKQENGGYINTGVRILHYTNGKELKEVL